jgi:hypothetical protein
MILIRHSHNTMGGLAKDFGGAIVRGYLTG